MLSAYIEGLKVFYKRLLERGRMQDLERPPRPHIYLQAILSAQRAQAGFRKAGVQLKDGDLDGADATAKRALLVLRESTKKVPTDYRHSFLMRDWRVAKVARHE
ncbi:hypothetical protein H0H92_011120 [Tricholoma furcatifolium]|nr:hypothetical protein H0H92_011120 [Tricholoma furcatifolium]